MNQFILVINGPICSGKTWAVNVIMEQYKRIFRLSSNKIKFLISDYTPDRDRKLVQECLLSVGDKMLERGMSLIMEGGSVAQGDLNQKLEELAQKHNLRVTYVNVEAPIPVLKARFQERVDAFESGKSKSNLSVTDDAGFMKRYDAYLNIKDQAVETFDSSILSPEEIAKGILAIV
jgi:predicted kinase